MKKIKYIIIHCSATREDVAYTVEQMEADHKARGFRTIGYHYYIRRDGTVTQHRGHDETGAHCKGYNACSIGICYEGGLDTQGKPANTLTDAQRKSLGTMIRVLQDMYPDAALVGHRDLNPDKECPCFDVRNEFDTSEQVKN